jgi:hypothetical protein
LNRKTLVAIIAADPAMTEISKKTLWYNAPTVLRMKSETDTTQRTTPLLSILAWRSCEHVFESMPISLIRPNVKIANVKALVVIIRGKVDSGAEMPKRGYRAFANRPTNITNAILRLTDRENPNATLSVFTPKAPRMTNPGRNVR